MDIRDEAEATKGYIDGAVSMPLSELENARQKFPKQKTAPIIITANDDKEAKRAFSIVREWGYKNTSILQGGVMGWAQAGNPLNKGQLGSKITYVPKPVPGSISVKAFQKIARSTPSNTIIIDVRDAEETAKGMLKGAINIPTQDISSRLSEIPKGKKVVVHCKSGTRASMAYQTLKENGFDAYFLNATILIKSDGKFKIRS